MTPQLYVFGVRGSGAEVFCHWYAKHLSDGATCLHLDLVATPDGRLISGKQSQEGDGPFHLALVQDVPLHETNGKQVLVLNDAFSTFSARWRNPDKTKYNLDPLATEVWKSHARAFNDHPATVNMERFLKDGQYRLDLEQRLGLSVLDIEPENYDFGNYGEDAKHLEYCTAFDPEVLELNSQLFETRWEVTKTNYRSPSSFFHEGLKRYALGQFAESARCFRNAGDDLIVKGNLATALVASREFEEAHKQFEGVDLETVPKASMDYAMLLAYEGREPESWRYAESRFECWGPSIDLQAALGKHRRWAGEDTKRLLYWLEGGLGDQIQFVRYVREIQNRWGCEVTVACQPELILLLQRSGFDAVVKTNHIHGWDRWLPSMSAPLLIEEIPEPLLNFKERSIEGGIGICWQGSKNHAEDGFRSCHVEAFGPLLDLGVNLVNLQYDRSVNKMLNPPITHLADLARVINGLDCVVTVDSAVGHLAGALGKPCLLLLSWKCDPRWGHEGTTSAWYPEHTLIRQPTMNDWPSVIEECVHKLSR